MVRDSIRPRDAIGSLLAALAITASASADDPLWAWGRDERGQSSAPPAIGRITQLSAGDAHSAALNAFGGVMTWGDNSNGQCTVPSGLRFSAISLGGWHSVAISAGRAHCWGRNTFGQCNVPAGLEGVVAIGAGANHSIAVTGDRRVWCWGAWYACDVPSSLQEHTIAVDGGYEHSLALLDNGTVGAWGRNDFAQCTVPSGVRGVVAVVAGDYFSLALNASGIIRAWGDNSSGQCDVPGWIGHVSRIDAGASHVVALRSNGTVVTWGGNSDGQSSPPPGLSRVAAIAAGSGHSLAAQTPLPPGGTPWITTVDPSGGAAFTTIQQAIDASPADRPAVIQLRPGTYTAGGDAIATVIDRSVELIALDGPAVTTIDGAHERRGVLCASGYGASLKVRGITFSRCRGRPAGNPLNLDARGGAIRAEGAPELIVDGCRFLDCTSPADDSQYCGSGIWYRGIWAGLDGSAPNPAPPPCRLTNCLFERCERAAVGTDGWGPVIQSSTFRSCQYGWGAALLASPGISIDGCTFESNTGGPLGGAVCLTYGYGHNTVTNCTFTDNIGNQGGAMFVAGMAGGTQLQRSRIANCSFIGNQALDEGGALNQCAWTDIEQCSFVGNRGLFGRSIRGAWWRPPRLVGCTFDTCCPVWPLNGAEWGPGNTFEPRCTECAGDLECDGLVDGNDLGILVARWGPAQRGDTADINGDSFVDGTDLGELLATWGVCPQE